MVTIGLSARMGGSVRAKWIVVATNAYTTYPWPQIRSELIYLPYFNLSTAPLPEVLRATILPGREGDMDTRTVMTSFRFDKQGRLVFGSIGALKGMGRSIHRGWARRSLLKLFPQLGHVAFESEWYGKIGLTDDHLPKFHHLANRVFSFSCYNGRGIAPGTVFGRMMAQVNR